MRHQKHRMLFSYETCHKNFTFIYCDLDSQQSRLAAKEASSNVVWSCLIYYADYAAWMPSQCSTCSIHAKLTSTKVVWSSGICFVFLSLLHHLVSCWKGSIGRVTRLCLHWQKKRWDHVRDKALKARARVCCTLILAWRSLCIHLVFSSYEILRVVLCMLK